MLSASFTTNSGLCDGRNGSESQQEPACFRGSEKCSSLLHFCGKGVVGSFAEAITKLGSCGKDGLRCSERFHPLGVKPPED